MTVEERKSLNPFGLYGVIEQFASDQQHSRDVDWRFLATYMKGVLDVIRPIRDSSIGPDLRARINEFRAKEIEAELEKKRRETEILERDLKTIQRALADKAA